MKKASASKTLASSNATKAQKSAAAKSLAKGGKKGK